MRNPGTRPNTGFFPLFLRVYWPFLASFVPGFLILPLGLASPGNDRSEWLQAQRLLASRHASAYRGPCPPHGTPIHDAFLPLRFSLVLEIRRLASRRRQARPTAARLRRWGLHPHRAILAADGSIEWEAKIGSLHDLHLLPDGHVLFETSYQKLVEMDPKTNKVVWQYDASKANGNAGKPVEVHAFQRLADGVTMIAESGPSRILEVDKDGKILRETKLKIAHSGAHRDTRLVRKLDTGTYLVCQEADGIVREYEPGACQARPKPGKDRLGVCRADVRQARERRPRTRRLRQQLLRRGSAAERQHADHDRQRPQRARSDAGDGHRLEVPARRTRRISSSRG